jgi:hippurate hydrolase
MRIPVLTLLGGAIVCCAAVEEPTRELARSKLQGEMPGLVALYQHLHANPELSFQEVKTAGRLAEELRRAGCEVTTGVGTNGVVALLKNGAGPTVLVRTDMDALPVKEQTGLSFASRITARDASGKEVPVMHACGHDLHMTCLVGVARLLGQLKQDWRGTLVLIGQPAEEIGGGARAMLKDGLFTRFPKPDVCLALHDKSDLPAGMVGYNPGHMLASVDSVDITVRGVGGHGAWPQTTKDPVVLASQIVLALQTIVSREIEPGQAAVVTVGSIHGGTAHNIVPDEVKLQMTVRSYTEEVRRKTLDAIQRIARSQALSGGVPEDRLPVIRVAEDSTPSTYNDPVVSERVANAFRQWLGSGRVKLTKPVMGGEDFSEYGRTAEKIPICLFWVGGVKQEIYDDAMRAGKTLPSLHSPFWAPDAEKAIETGVTAMTAAVLECLQAKPGTF